MSTMGTSTEIYGKAIDVCRNLTPSFFPHTTLRHVPCMNEFTDSNATLIDVLGSPKWLEVFLPPPPMMMMIEDDR